MYDTYLKVPVAHVNELAPILAMAANTFAVSGAGAKAMVVGPVQGRSGTPETIIDGVTIPTQAAAGDPNYTYVLVRFYTPIASFGNVAVCDPAEGKLVCGE